ncbi:MAG: hypothetical protein SFY69_05355 [Planctomycetota bacterium]|nr:hypothetical protein [Planctomycetota bacterium]
MNIDRMRRSRAGGRRIPGVMALAKLVAISAFVALVALGEAGALVGCAAPSRKGDASLRVGPVSRAYLESEVRLRPVVIGGLRAPDDALRAAASRLGKHVGREVVVEDACEVELEPGEYDVVQRVIERCEAVRAMTPTTVLVVPASGAWVTGYATSRGEGEPGRGRRAVVVVMPEGIARRSGFFVRPSKLWEWTLVHEMGHVLGVPASSSHAWDVEGLGVHCTNPGCVMYTGFDWRVLWTGIVRGWPLEFCEDCARELREAGEAGGAERVNRERNLGVG